MTTKKRLRIHAASLHYFDAVRRAGSIREAARQLNIASSAINRQILSLEAELGGQVFERLPSGLKLTAIGESLANHVINVLRGAERMESEIAALHGLRSGHIEIATLEGVCHRILPEAIAAFGRRYPRITVGVTISKTEDIPAMIDNGDAHLGLAFEVSRRQELRRLAVAKFPLGGVVRPDSPLASRSSITVQDCREFAVILPKSNFANRSQLHPIMLQAGMRSSGRYEAGSIDLMKQLVLRGLGIALMTNVGVESELEAGELVHIPLSHSRKYVYSELGLYTRAGTNLPVVAEVFAEHIASVFVPG